MSMMNSLYYGVASGNSGVHQMCTPLPRAGAVPAAEGDPGEPVLPFRVAAAMEQDLAWPAGKRGATARRTHDVC